MPSAFISYNKADKEVARELGIILASEDIGVWFDEWEVRAGDSLTGKVEAGLAATTDFVIIWSHHSEKSDWVRVELRAALTLAIAEGAPRIIPIRLDDTELPPLIRDLKYITWNDGSEENRDELVNAVLGRKPSETLVRAVVRKYHELTIREDAGETHDPLPYAACPGCGADDFRRSRFNRLDHVYYVIACNECSWSEWTE